MQEKVLQLKITLTGSHPPIWRRILVKSSLNLGDLHYVIQTVFEQWSNDHLHMFINKKETYGNSEDDDYDEDDTRLSDVLHKSGSKITYVYDFGDNWDHGIVLEKILPIDKSQQYPVCLAGKRACPYEDVGGIWSYESNLEIMKNPKHPAYTSTVEWMNNGEFDPEHFDLEEINKRLRKAFPPR